MLSSRMFAHTIVFRFLGQHTIEPRGRERVHLEGHDTVSVDVCQGESESYVSHGWLAWVTLSEMSLGSAYRLSVAHALGDHAGGHGALEIGGDLE